MWNLPNILTLLRIAMIPVFIVVYYMTSWEWHNLAAAAIFGLAAATDWVDGYVARKYNLITAFGAFLDPVADKLIVVAAMVVLLEVHATPWFALPAIVIIGREIVISALREWMAEMGYRGTVAVATDRQGKDLGADGCDCSFTCRQPRAGVSAMLGLLRFTCSGTDALVNGVTICARLGRN